MPGANGLSRAKNLLSKLYHGPRGECTVTLGCGGEFDD